MNSEILDVLVEPFSQGLEIVDSLKFGIWRVAQEQLANDDGVNHERLLSGQRVRPQLRRELSRTELPNTLRENSSP